MGWLVDMLTKTCILECAVEADRLFDETSPNKRKARGEWAAEAIAMALDAGCVDWAMEHTVKYLESNIPRQVKTEIMEMMGSAYSAQEAV